jgi:hypothetical protein
MFGGTGALLMVRASPLVTVWGVGENESVTENVCVTFTSVVVGVPLIVAVAALKNSPVGKGGVTVGDQV